MIGLQPKKARLADNPFYRQLTQKGYTYEPLSTAVVMPVDSLSLEGALDAAQEGLIVPVLIGSKARIEETARHIKKNLKDIEIVDCANEEVAAQKSVEMAKNGKIEAIMKGHLPTHVLLHEVVNEKAIRTGRKMSHIFVVFTKDYPKPLYLTDAALNIDPDLETKRDIIQNAINLFRCLQKDTPKVAVLSATEQVNSDIMDTIEAAALSKMADRGTITGGIVDGPLAFDNAISKEAAKAKGIKSEVAGDADILIMPDLQAGNMLYKQMRYLSGYEAAGIVMGARLPIILTSRAATAPTRLASCALAVLVARHQETGRKAGAV